MSWYARAANVGRFLRSPVGVFQRSTLGGMRRIAAIVCVAVCAGFTSDRAPAPVTTVPHTTPIVLGSSETLVDCPRALGLSSGFPPNVRRRKRLIRVGPRRSIHEAASVGRGFASLRRHRMPRVSSEDQRQGRDHRDRGCQRR